MQPRAISIARAKPAEHFVDWPAILGHAKILAVGLMKQIIPSLVIGREVFLGNSLERFVGAVAHGDIFLGLQYLDERLRGLIAREISEGSRGRDAFVHRLLL